MSMWHGINDHRDFYENTQEVREALGLRQCPDYVLGDQSLPYIAHNRLRGEFIFIAEIPEGCHVTTDDEEGEE